MNKTIVIGHSPNPNKTAETSPTLGKLRKWMTNAGVYEYDFVNLVDEFVPNLTLKKVTLNPGSLKKYKCRITLGNLADTYLTRNKVKHFKAPHPSGLNRQFNDKTFEPKVMNNIKEYLNENRNR